MRITRNCPLCGNRLVAGPEDMGLDLVYCEESVILEGGKKKNHYLEDLDNREITQYLLPYRIVTTQYENQENTSKVSVASVYKSGRNYFRTIAKLPAMHFDTEENIRKRLKTIVVFS